jgi:hypothetical protein
MDQGQAERLPLSWFQGFRLHFPQIAPDGGSVLLPLPEIITLWAWNTHFDR